MLKADVKWFNTRYIGDRFIVFVYSMRSSPMATACRIKKKIPQAEIYLIITDLPQFMDLGQSRLKAVLKKIDWKNIKKMQQKFDGFILYAEKMAEYLEIPSNKWILMEGSYDTSEQIEATSKRKKAVMYSGKLDEQYGIKMLVDAFMSIKEPDIELWLTGGGNTESYIKKCSQKDGRIKFYGFFPSRDDVLKKQSEASLLVNMRLPSEPASGYCFPSKLFEYMATGTPVLSFDIAGIPRKYLDYLFIVNEESKEALAKMIEETMKLDGESLKECGNAAREFVLREKNTKTQASKMWKFIDRLR